MSARAVVVEWGSATVGDGRLSVELSASRPKGWTERFEAVVERLERPGRGYGAVTAGKRKVHVDDVTPGAEDDVRHFLESAVLQANAAVGAEEPEDDEDEDASSEDEEMTARFRSFADA